MKKTWIKVKRGILEPKHIYKLGQAWYLYFYILDNADWETGTIREWKDKYASDELGKPLGIVREHRKRLAAEGYITVEKNKYSQTITIRNWTDPRKYDGVVLNQSSEKPELCGDEEIQSSGESIGKSMGKSSGKSVGEQADDSLPSLNHISHTADSHSTELIKLTVAEKKIINQPDINPYFVIWKRETGLMIKQKKGDKAIQDTANLFTDFIEAGITPKIFCEAIIAQKADVKYKVVTPHSVKKWAMNSVKKKGSTFWQRWSRKRTGDDYRKSWQSWLSEGENDEV